jgi:hypothetical protein
VKIHINNKKYSVFELPPAEKYDEYIEIEISPFEQVSGISI